MGGTRVQTNRSRLWLAGVLVATSSAMAQPLLVPDMSLVDAVDGDQPGGPSYPFHIGTFEFTNAEFVVFLNDALANLDNDRGAYMYFDTATGDVYVNGTATGGSGSGPGSLTVKMFAPSEPGRIAYGAGAFGVEVGYESHPVTGVSWYGALKCCNWLTLQAGFDPDQRCYTEATNANLDGWHPVTIAQVAWTTRDLSDIERQTLVGNYLGFRLPMDNRQVEADGYNEWYKAGAWSGSENMLYGFGRDTLAPRDANYAASDDPFETDTPPTTPVGFYDGVNRLADGNATQTWDTENQYGLYDMSGNVGEWVQDLGTRTIDRVYRGGAWITFDPDVGTLDVTDTSPAFARDYVGFRVALSNVGRDVQVDPDDSSPIEFSGPVGEPFDSQTVSITLLNQQPFDMAWEATSDVAWIRLDDDVTASDVLAAFTTRNLTLDLASAAENLEIGSYSATVTFDEVSTDGSRRTFALYTVNLTVTGTFIVSPSEGFTSEGSLGGPFFPASKTYTVENDAEDDLLQWRAEASAAGESWLLIDGGTVASGTLEFGFTAEVPITFNAAGVAALGAGTHVASVIFSNRATGAQAIRTVRLVVGQSPMTIDMAIVFGDDVQVGGPWYDFRIATHEITNAQFAAFLNDSYLNIGVENHPAATYTFHDTDSGDLYMGAAVGAAGTNGIGTLLFDASDGGAITFSSSQYTVDSDAEDLPVVGVSWYGALKFSNWLTTHQGMDPSQRVYTEGAQPVDWLAEDWDVGNPLSLLGKAGYRLPMDGGSSGPDEFGEWYKAATYRGLDEDEVTPLFDAVYGFGGDVLSDVHANYAASGDPFDEGPTPVGWYDGVNQLSGGAVTSNSANGYGLYDMCGNVAEWMQDVGDAADQRATRGGHWQNTIGSPLLENAERESDLAVATRSFTGLRLVQTVPGNPATVAAEEACAGGAPCAFNAFGPVGGIYGPTTMSYVITGDAAFATEYRVCADKNWVSLNASGPSECVAGLIEPNGGVAIEVAFNTETNALRAAPRPDLEMSFVPATDVLPGGPDYSFRIAANETTNAAFVEFLNDAKANPGNVRGYYMYFNTETGDVYVNDAAIGGSGTDSRSISLFAAAENEQVSYDDTDNVYIVADGFDEYPITHVSWFGAVKYCNWLTVESGLENAERVYREGAYAGDWHPVTITTEDWWGTEETAFAPQPLPASRNLSDEERRSLVDDYSGFRLPMDGDAVAPYNEWLKAAACRDADGVSLFDAVYGFGRDVAGGADANFLSSGDPFDDGTAPVGWFDGAHLLSDEVTVTNDTDNCYGLYDMSGNVAEWTQDFGIDATDRGLRGGSWSTAVGNAELSNQTRATFLADQVASTIGFRVVQSALDHRVTITFQDNSTGASETRGVRLLLREPMSVSPTNGFDASWMYGGPFTGQQIGYTLASESASEMAYAVTVSQVGTRWLDIDGASSSSGSLGASTPVIVSTNTAGETFTPGTYDATVSFQNTTTGYAETRSFSMAIIEPLEVTNALLGDEPFEIDLVWGTWRDPPAEQTYTLQNRAAVPIEYETSAAVTWLDIEVVAASGTLTADDNAPAGDDEVAVVISSNDATQNVSVGVYDETITFRNITAGTEVTRDVRLTIRDPLRICVDVSGLVCDVEDAGWVDPKWAGSFGGPFEGVTATSYVLANAIDASIEFEVRVEDVDWLEVNGVTSYADTLLPGLTAQIDLAVNENANLLNGGVYTADVLFEDTTTGHTQVRTVTLEVTAGLSLTPTSSFSATGSVGGLFNPKSRVYVLQNLDASDSLNWTASVDPSVDWLLIDGKRANDPNDLVTGELGGGESVGVAVSIDQVVAAAVTIPEGQDDLSISTTLSFHYPVDQSISLTVTLHVVRPHYSLEEVVVSADDVQPGGPTYAFTMGTYPITNEEFVVFLNDAMAHPADERGRHLFFDLTNGELYMNDSVDGETGTDPGDRAILLFSPSLETVGHAAITFDGSTYQVRTAPVDYARHPVTGVSWYGAVKFCNWLTIDQGFGVSQRCYTETTDADVNGWHPVSISTGDWRARDLNDDERSLLVAECRGYRLPMDEGYNNANPPEDRPDGYNEWYKAAAWNGTTNLPYAFGRSVLEGADANYLGSGDLFETDSPPTTPVDYFDGVNLLADETATRASDNHFGIQDLAGNTFDWLQGRFNTSGNSIANRTYRGGSWLMSVDSLWMKTTRRANDDSDTVHEILGLRVLRVPAPWGDDNRNGVIDLDDVRALSVCIGGPGETELNSGCGEFDSGDGDVDLADVRELFNQFGRTP